jgi:alkyl hydroperoxide reductase subunit AhpF
MQAHDGCLQADASHIHRTCCRTVILMYRIRKERKMKSYAQNLYDLIVIGAGPAGMSAASAAFDRGISRLLLLEKTSETGGRLRDQSEAESGLRIYHKAVGSDYVLTRFRTLLATYEVPTRLNTEVSSISLSQDPAGTHFDILLSDQTSQEPDTCLLARAVILTTGTKKESGNIVPDSLMDSLMHCPYFFTAGDITGKKALPDDACIEGAAAGRNAAELLLS